VAEIKLKEKTIHTADHVEELMQIHQKPQEKFLKKKLNADAQKRRKILTKRFTLRKKHRYVGKVSCKAYYKLKAKLKVSNNDRVSYAYYRKTFKKSVK
jgi:hypothetical protein